MKDAGCLGVWGRRGSGKTTCVKALLKVRPRVICFDPMRDYAPGGRWRRADTLGGVLDHLKATWHGSFRISYVPPGDHVAALSRLADLCWQAQAPYDEGRDTRQLTLVVEEMNLSCPSYPLPREYQGFSRAVLQGRHRGIEIIGVSQRPALVSKDFRAQLTESYVLPLADVDDQAAILRQIGRQHADQLRALKPHHYIRFAEGEVSTGRNVKPRC